jgi:hypothetical protein
MLVKNIWKKCPTNSKLGWVKVDLPIEEGYFNIDPCDFCGEESYLITPQADAKWNKNNLHLRSIIVDKNGNVTSCGFKKFFNYLEKPDCYSNPEKYYDWCIEEKRDGSLVIVDFHNGLFSMRTRGTSSYKTQKNNKEFEILPTTYPKVVEYLSKNNHLSLLFEMETPSNVIVIRQNEVKFTFLNAVDKRTLRMVDPEELLEIWKCIGCPPSPERYSFNESRDLQSIYSVIKEWKGKEGIVLTYNNGQNKLKFKSDWYVFISRIKSQLNSTSNLIEYYVESKMPSEEDFSKKIEIDYDYEIAIQLKDEISKICLAGEEVKKIIENMKDFVQSIRGFETRKEQARHIQTTYGNRSSFVFSLLDGKELENNQKIKLIEQTL